MNDSDMQDFVTRFAAAWAERDGERFLALWHPDGTLHSPLKIDRGMNKLWTQGGLQYAPPIR